MKTIKHFIESHIIKNFEGDIRKISFEVKNKTITYMIIEANINTPISSLPFGTIEKKFENNKLQYIKVCIRKKV